MAESGTHTWLPSLHGYRRTWLRGDVLAGLAAGCVVIPQAMAYATIADLPVEVGLYTCMLPMLAYALLGGARALSVSTTSTIAVLVATTLADLSGRDADELLGAAFTLTFLVGLCLLAMRLFRLGSLVENISPATLTGIRLGVGLTVAASQLPNLLGVEAYTGDGGFFAEVVDALRQLPDASGVTTAVSATAILVLLLVRRFLPTLPGPLLVVAGGIALVAFTGVEERGLALIDRVPTGLPSVSLPVPSDLVDLLPGAVAIAVMSFLETVLVARTNRQRSEPPIDTDQELLATGVASLAGGLTQTLPPAGGFSQSAVNLRSGAHTQVAGIVTAALAVLVALLLAPLLDDLPRAVLAAMVLVAIIGLLDPSDLRRFARIDRAELWVAVVVAAISLAGGMLLGVAVGVGLTLVLVLRAVNQPRVRPLYARPGGGWTAVPQEPAEPVPSQLLLLHLDGGLYTGNAQATHDAIVATALAAEPRPTTVVLEGTAVRMVSVTMLDTFRALTEELETEGVRLVIAELPPATLEMLRRSDWFVGFEESGAVYPTVDDAVAAART
ncbi:MAG: solute carrier family 23 protein [Nocardioides sp.]